MLLKLTSTRFLSHPNSPLVMYIGKGEYGLVGQVKPEDVWYEDMSVSTIENPFAWSLFLYEE